MKVFLVLASVWVTVSVAIPIPLASYMVVVAPTATEIERFSADTIATQCGNLAVIETTGDESGPRILVGFDTVEAYTSDLPIGEEAYILFSIGDGNGSIALTGAKGSPRGTWYAAYSFLHDVIGVTLVSPDASITIPVDMHLSSDLTLNISVSGGAFAFREIFIYEVMYNPTWASFMRENFYRPNKPGGGVVALEFYSYDIVPPSVYQSAHPEWYGGSPQVCWSSASLVTQMITFVLAQLIANPNTNVIRIWAQDDPGYCQTPDEMAVIIEEGGAPSGVLLRAINTIADAVAILYPNVSIETLAYQHTLAAPTRTVPRSNVIIQFACLACDFGQVLEANSPSNGLYYYQLEAWSKITPQLYIWHYVTDFDHFLLPYPDWTTIDANFRIFHRLGVKGVFMEGDYVAPAGDLQSLKAYLILELLWDPYQDATRLLSEFLYGYYGPIGSIHVLRYMERILKSYQSTAMIGPFPTLGAYEKVYAAYLDPLTVIQSYQDLTECVDRTEEVYAFRCSVVRLCPLYIILLRWEEMRSWWSSQRWDPWPLESDNPYEMFGMFSDVYNQLNMGTHGLAEFQPHGLDWLRDQIGTSAPIKTERCIAVVAVLILLGCTFIIFRRASVNKP